MRNPLPNIFDSFFRFASNRRLEKCWMSSHKKSVEESVAKVSNKSCLCQTNKLHCDNIYKWDHFRIRLCVACFIVYSFQVFYNDPKLTLLNHLEEVKNSQSFS